ncbi:L-seryl-tRNA(Sec) selenium transferase [Halanaerobiaceae bacterium Z-7014]|uniref:L-seryl-tRNA(Sec) selenium transferase n=1 Tax=Halonatronomonas betaini TaxID=2778430 RepID=A0A931FBF5_9FIRM|nr:L-seryl-tRNA(Sec) selenium transferase [Halonatronomonas betaini]MBF8437922.1 L-seryl-tRNA(Sec) selenium transferase [Halonatronomonas betaini]
MNKNQLLRQLPSVNDIIKHEKADQLTEEYNRDLLIQGIRDELEYQRRKILKLLDKERFEEAEAIVDSLTLEKILDNIASNLEKEFRPQLAPVVNGTGVIVHTNLGRSLLSKEAKEMVEMVASHYNTLEIDRNTGERGSRYDNVEELICRLTGAEAAFVVNNNAAAVLLAISTFASGKEIIISRGELIEIGGSFRIPAVMEQGGADLVEVGTTNKVYIEDYAREINENTGMLLKVHTSNYKVVGFTEEVGLDQLVQLGHKYDIPVLDDLGSGVFLDMTEFGLEREPTVAERVEAGGDIVTFSGDKILGGPQAGIIVGRKDLIEKMKKHPLTRAVRVDKYTLAALEGTLKAYLRPETVIDKIPTLNMLSLDRDDLREPAKELQASLKDVLPDNIKCQIEEDISRVGGGAYPLSELPTLTVTIDWPGVGASKIASALRSHYPPIFTRIKDEKLVIDLRTLQEGDQEIIIDAFKELEVE